MASYYYLISSLPDLKSDGEMPLSYEDFLDMCQTTVSASTYTILKNLTLSSNEGPLIKEWAQKQEGFVTLYDNNDNERVERKPVGFLIVINGYVDGIYVMPEHRRKGIAKKAVMDYLKSGGVINRLHIIRTNTPALKFWESIFVLEPENDCPVDVLYHIVRRKEH
jgi:ribosomal protein S18 acetylase RimI-like enzyme